MKIIITKACIVYNSLLLLKFKFAAERAKPAPAEVSAIVRFAKTGRGDRGRIFNILAVYVYCYYVVVSVEGFFNVSSSTINVSNRMYMFNPSYPTVHPLRMCSLVLCVVDSVHMSN